MHCRSFVILSVVCEPSDFVKFIAFIYIGPLIQGLGVKNNAICDRYMVVFQYGSAVLFNVDDHEVDFFLNIARRHASGLLSELRKDGNYF